MRLFSLICDHIQACLLTAVPQQSEPVYYSGFCLSLYSLGVIVQRLKHIALITFTFLLVAFLCVMIHLIQS